MFGSAMYCKDEANVAWTLCGGALFKMYIKKCNESCATVPALVSILHHLSNQAAKHISNKILTFPIAWQLWQTTHFLERILVMSCTVLIIMNYMLR